MIGLDRLMKIKGVVAAGQFSEGGKIIRSVGNIPKELMEQTAELCSSETKHFEELVKQYNSKMEGWDPLVGWAVWGGKYAITIVGNTGVIIESKYADLNQLRVDLIGSEATGARPRNY